MKSTFILELKRAIINLRFVLAIIIGIYLCYYGLTDYYQFTSLDLPKNVINAYRGWFTALGFGSRSFFIYAVAIICTLPFSYSYIEDKNSGYLRNILYRVDYKRYFRSKLLVNSIVGGLTLFIPIVFIVGFVYSLFGMASSILTNKKISALLIPSILYMGINMFTNFIEKAQYSSFTTVFPWMDSRTTILSLYGELLAIFILSIVIIKVMHRRDAY